MFYEYYASTGSTPVLHVSTQVVGPVLVVLPVVLEPVHMYLGRAKDGEGGGKEGEGRRSVFLM